MRDSVLCPYLHIKVSSQRQPVGWMKELTNLSKPEVAKIMCNQPHHTQLNA